MSAPPSAGSAPSSGASATSIGSDSPTGRSVTSPTPRLARPIRSAAPRERSMMRRPWSGWRSVTVTTTESPVSCRVTRTRLPSGRLG